jgi:uncharacterized protein
MSTADLYQRLQSDLRLAMVARDGARVSVLRTAISSVDNTGAVAVEPTAYQVGFSEDVPRRYLDDEAIRELLAEEIEERQRAIDLYTRLDQAGHAEALRDEVAILTSYL